MGYYSVALDMTGRLTVVIGGGIVAERKVEGLLEAGAAVTVISPCLTGQLARWVKEARISHVARNYAAGDLAGYELAFVATSDPRVNGAIFHEGRKRGLWVNTADDPAHCDFILPSVLRRGELTIAVSTGGGSPALSKAIREELENYFTSDYDALTKVVSTVRKELRQRSVVPSSQAWECALNGELRELIHRGELTRARTYLLDQLGGKPS
ncbi:MAG TPA: bifunctional precorrin-2 dehydrogenase/sirohydrochlorin ferrochelatase [Candidatus Acidoferrales bacterium]|nr:bifunctional precorrin-2 dehydrogenase/sirohydrochlorin ferrochelatase [Candidatus Acidoferrales bacterium]